MTFAIVSISMSASGLPEDAGNAQREDDNTENKSVTAEGGASLPIFGSE